MSVVSIIQKKRYRNTIEMYVKCALYFKPCGKSWGKGTTIPEFAINGEEYLFVREITVTQKVEICCMNVWKKGLVR